MKFSIRDRHQGFVQITCNFPETFSAKTEFSRITSSVEPLQTVWHVKIKCELAFLHVYCEIKRKNFNYITQ